MNGNSKTVDQLRVIIAEIKWMAQLVGLHGPRISKTKILWTLKNCYAERLKFTVSTGNIMLHLYWNRDFLYCCYNLHYMKMLIGDQRRHPRQQGNAHLVSVEINNTFGPTF